MQQLSKLLPLAILFCFYSPSSFAECTDYYVAPKDDTSNARITTICNTDGKIEISHKDVAPDERVELQPGENTSSSSSSPSSSLSEQSSSSSQSPSSQLSDNSNQQNVVSSGPSELEKQLETGRDGSDAEKIKLAGYKFFNIVFDFIRKWADLLTLALAGIAVLYAAHAWRTARNETKEVKKANALMMQPYFEFVGASLSWATDVRYFQPYVIMKLRVKNTGQSVAMDIRHAKADAGRIALSEGNAELDTKKYNASTKDIITHSINQGTFLSENQLEALFPAEDITREVVNPGETVDFTLMLPMQGADSKMDSDGVVIDDWNIEGSFLFSDTFKKHEPTQYEWQEELRTYRFNVHFGDQALISKSDSAGALVVNDNGQRVVVGILQE